MKTYNPKYYDLDLLQYFDMKFDDTVDGAKDVYHFYTDYNKIPGDRIVAWQSGYIEDDCAKQKMTFRFYLK